MAHLDPERPQQIRRSDARQLQKLRRVVGATGEDHFFVGSHFGRSAALAAFDVAHADRAFAVEQDSCRMRVGPDMDIRPLHRWMEKRGRRADAQAILNRALGVGYALLYGAVVVGVAWNAE